MAKINISLPDGLLEDIDAKAAELGTTRSGLIQEASAKYVTALDDEKAEAERKARFDAAYAHAREIAKLVGPDWNPEEIIRRDRDTDHGRREPDD